jgi:phage FluMu protein gp41
MKQLSVAMKAELTASDLLDALVKSSDPKQLLVELLETPGVLSGFAKKHRAAITKAVTGYLADQHQLAADKVIYTPDGRVLIEAHTLGTALRTIEPTPARNRVAPGGHVKSNKGVFKFLREYLAEERKKKTKELTFTDVLKEAQFMYPKLTARLLQIYLHDKRQLKNVDYNARRGTVLLK